MFSVFNSRQICLYRENKASSIKQMGKLISQSVTENLKIRNSGPSVSDHVRLDRIAHHRLVMDNKGITNTLAVME